MIYAVLMSLFVHQGAMASVSLHRAFASGSACDIHNNYVGLIWKGELVDAKYELQYSETITSWQQLESLALSIAGTDGLGAEKPEVGYWVVVDGQLLLLNLSTPEHQALRNFIAVQCQP